jgi:hypothetical protein
MEKEFGRISKNPDTEVVVRVDDFKGERGVTIREFTTSERYTGFTKSGTRIPADKWQEFLEIVNKVEIPESQTEQETSETQEAQAELS